MALTTFTSGQVLTAAQLNAVQANDYNQTVSTKTANYVLTAADKGTRVVMNAAGATTITVDTSLFSAGDTVVLQNIGAGVTTVTAGTATVSSAGPLAIPQYGSGTLYFTSAGVSIYFPSAVTVGSSAVVQVKSGILTSTFSVVASLGVFSAVTGLTVSITPTSASNKILLLGSLNATNGAASQGVNAIFTGGNSSNYRGDTGGNRTRAAVSNLSAQNAYYAPNSALMYLDSPATTSAITYGISVTYNSNGSGTDTVYVNFGAGEPNNAAYEVRNASTITAIEVTP
jgi:hypothetical protein